MTPSPLHDRHAGAGAVMLRYAGAGDGAGADIVESFGDLEVEYAALRKGCVLLDLPHRGTVRVTGADRVEFLNRMLTQELKGVEPFDVRRSFWLNRKGRLDADLRVVHLADSTLFELDLLTAASTAGSLEAFVFSEDVRFEDASRSFHRLALHGPTAPALLAAVGATAPEPGRAAAVTIAGLEVIVDRQDDTGDPGLHLLVPATAAVAVYDALISAGVDDSAGQGTISRGAIRLKPAGWGAFNIARIEAGTPLFNIDFGPTSLPAETGVIEDRVSFRKGCYLGQEVVARMHSLGQPKQRLVALRIDASDDPLAQPVTGANLSLPTDDARKPVGAVTSSTRSPMLGDACIAFAQVKWDFTPPGTALSVQTDAGWLSATVQDSLRFWRRPDR